MMAMFAGENRDDWDNLLPAVMMAYRSSVQESMGYSPYRLMFGKHVLCLWTLAFRFRSWTCRTHVLYGSMVH